MVRKASFFFRTVAKKASCQLAAFISHPTMVVVIVAPDGHPTPEHGRAASTLIRILVHSKHDDLRQMVWLLTHALP